MKKTSKTNKAIKVSQPSDLIVNPDFAKWKHQNDAHADDYSDLSKTIVHGNFAITDTHYLPSNRLFAQQLYRCFPVLKDYDLRANGMVIAGGICCNMMLSKRRFTKCNDVDFFMIDGRSKSDRMSATMIKETGQVNPVDRIKKWIFDMRALFQAAWTVKDSKLICNTVVVGNNGTVTMSITQRNDNQEQVKSVKLQLIITEWTDVKAIFASFDLDCCRVAFDGNDLIFDQSSMLCYATQTINVDFCNYCPGLYEKRLIKYFWRGFRLRFNQPIGSFRSLQVDGQCCSIKMNKLTLFALGMYQQTSKDSNLLLVGGITQTSQESIGYIVDGYGCHVQNQVCYDFLNLPKSKIDDVFLHNFVYYADADSDPTVPAKLAANKKWSSYKDIRFRIDINFDRCPEYRKQVIAYLTNLEGTHKAIKKDKTKGSSVHKNYDRITTNLSHLKFDNIFAILFAREAVNPVKYFEIVKVMPLSHYQTVNRFLRYTRHLTHIGYGLSTEIVKMLSGGHSDSESSGDEEVHVKKNKKIRVSKIESSTAQYSDKMNESFLNPSMIDEIKLKRLDRFCQDTLAALKSKGWYTKTISVMPSDLMIAIEQRFTSAEYRQHYKFEKRVHTFVISLA